MLRDESIRVEAVWCGVESEPGYESKCENTHRRLKRIVKARGALDAQEAEALREANRLKLWRHYGHASLAEYMELEMGYTARAAIERLRVAKAIEELPVIAAALNEGDLPFSKARELTRVATPETEQTWIQATTDKNMREVEQLVSGRERGDTPTDPPRLELRPRVLRYEVSAETVALVQHAKQILEKDLGERLDDDALIRTFARMVIDGAVGPERTHAPYQIAVTTCPECKRGWQDGGGLTVEMSPPALETAECDAQRIGSLDREERARATSDIPPALRREVLARDHHRCRVTGCRSSRNIDLHHLTPRAAGGEHTKENLLTVCESHHIASHEGALIIGGTASDPTFTRRSHNSFTIAALAVDTARVLKERGFSKDDVKVAVEKTRTHVGTTELKLEHWIEIALSYCPTTRPTST